MASKLRQNCAKKALVSQGHVSQGHFSRGRCSKGHFHEGFVHKGIFHEGFVHKGIFHEGEFCQNAEATLGYPRALALVTTCKPHNRRVTGAPPRIDEKGGQNFPNRGGSASNRSGSHQVGRILPKRRGHFCISASQAFHTDQPSKNRALDPKLAVPQATV